MFLNVVMTLLASVRRVTLFLPAVVHRPCAAEATLVLQFALWMFLTLFIANNWLYIATWIANFFQVLLLVLFETQKEWILAGFAFSEVAQCKRFLFVGRVIGYFAQLALHF